MCEIRCTRVCCMYVYGSNIFFVNCSLDQNEVFLFISFDKFQFEVWFVRYQDSDSCLLPGPILLESFLVIFLTLMQCLFVKVRSVSFRQHKDGFFDPFNQLISFDWSIETIETCVLIAAFVLFIFGVVFSVILYVIIIMTSCFFPQSL